MATKQGKPLPNALELLRECPAGSWAQTPSEVLHWRKHFNAYGHLRWFAFYKSAAGGYKVNPVVQPTTDLQLAKRGVVLILRNDGEPK